MPIVGRTVTSVHRTHDWRGRERIFRTFRLVDKYGYGGGDGGSGPDGFLRNRAEVNCGFSGSPNAARAGGCSYISRIDRTMSGAFFPRI